MNAEEMERMMEEYFACLQKIARRFVYEHESAIELVRDILQIADERCGGNAELLHYVLTGVHAGMVLMIERAGASEARGASIH
jgi:hypothetical protein